MIRKFEKLKVRRNKVFSEEGCENEKHWIYIFHFCLAPNIALQCETENRKQALLLHWIQSNHFIQLCSTASNFLGNVVILEATVTLLFWLAFLFFQCHFLLFEHFFMVVTVVRTFSEQFFIPGKCSIRSHYSVICSSKGFSFKSICV